MSSKLINMKLYLQKNYGSTNSVEKYVLDDRKQSEKEIDWLHNGFAKIYQAPEHAALSKTYAACKHMQCKDC